MKRRMESTESGSENIQRRTDFNNLNCICDWNHLERTAIEFHDLKKKIVINYAEVYSAKAIVSDQLESIRDFEFIGINYDIPEYCVPSLMLGIMSDGHGFVYVSQEPTVSAKMRNCLNLKHLLVNEITSDHKIISQFKVHDQLIYLVKIKDLRDQAVLNERKNCYAYAIATSGSTGLPKIVKVPHGCILPNILDLKRILAMRKTDKIAKLTSFTFDPSVVEIFLALCNAATLFMVSKALKSDTNRLLEEIHANRVNILQMTPSVFLHTWSTDRIRDTILGSDSSLRVLLLGGEPFPKAETFLRTRHPRNMTRIFNIYGITEVSCWASVDEITLPSSAIGTRFLGTVLSETIFEVRNGNGGIVTKGRGFLYIGCPIHLGSRTRICAVDDEDIGNFSGTVFRESGDVVDIDEEGRIFYHGRKDSTIKRFGNRVDLSRLERILLELNFVTNCYILWDEPTHKLYVCLATSEEKHKYPAARTRVIKHLEKVEAIYKPDAIHLLESFEFTSSGKISREFLRKQCLRDNEHQTTKDDFVAMHPEKVEELLKSVWRNCSVSESDGFIKLGGNSVKAIQMSNSLSELFHVEFPELIGMLLRDSTLDAVLVYIKKIIMHNPKAETEEDSKNYTPFEVETASSIENDTKERVMFDSPLTSTDHDDTCQWYKCRGKIHVNASEIKDSTRDIITGIRVLKTYNLQKCVDASPTVFRYANGKTFVTVGSHSGIVCTVALGEENRATSSMHEIKFPDRIEASVLVLDEFQGIVGCYDGNVYCFHLKTGEILWKFKTGDVVKCTAISCKQGEKIFVGSYDCYAYCLSRKDGSEIWKVKCSDGSITASGCLHPEQDCVLFGTLDGSCLALQQSSGKIIWKHRLSNPIFAAPIVLRDGIVLFCSVAGMLYCFDIEVNVELWRYSINGNIFSYIVKHDDPTTTRECIIVASQNKMLYCFERTGTSIGTLSLKYSLSFHSPIFATPWCKGDLLLVACTDGTVSLYSSSKTESLACIKLRGEVFSSPVIDDNFVIVGCRDNNLYILEIT